MTRSGLYAEAIRRYLQLSYDLDTEARLNAVYSDDPGYLDAGTEALRYSSLSEQDWPEELADADWPTNPPW